jgi:cytosine permease
MYAGVNICLPMIMVGSVFIQGLSLTHTIVAGIVGNLIAACLVALASYPGIEHGLPASVLTRVSLGHPWGTNLASLVIAITMVGWFAVQADLAGTAADGILKEATGISTPLLMILIVGATNVVFAVFGFSWMRKLSIWAVPALIVLSVSLFLKIAQTHSLREIYARPGSGSLTLMGAINIMVAGQIGAAFIASDISRYSKNHLSVWLGILGGVAPVATFMIALGALATASTSEQNPVMAIRALGLGIWALGLIVLAAFTTNNNNLYSGGLAVTNMIPRVPRWAHTLILGALGATLACMRITRYFITWLLILGSVFAPLVGVLLADYFFVCKRQIRLSEIYADRSSGKFSQGINFVALTAIVLGVIASHFTPPRFIQPLVSLVIAALSHTLGMYILHSTEPELSGEPE